MGNLGESRSHPANGLKNFSRNSIKSPIFPLLLLAIFTFLIELENFYGEDIVNARENYLSGEKLDFWGGVSTLAYSSIPDVGLRWQIWLGIFQISISSLGLILVFKLNRSKKSKKLGVYVISYFALIFGSQMTRDGLMFSLLLFGFGLLSVSSRESRPTKATSFALIVICLGMSFRPWLSLAIVPLVVIVVLNSKMKISKKLSAFCLIILVSGPVAIEVSSSKFLDLNRSYPEQQVMMMDLASTYCYTNNPRAGIEARKGLEIFTEDNNYSKLVCQLFRTDTWLSLTNGGNESSKGLKTDFWLLQPGQEESYKKLRDIWSGLILKDPISYVQNKILFAGKLLIGSESRGITLLSKDKISDRLKAIYKVPYDLALSLHVFSIFSLVLIIFIKPVIRFIGKASSGVQIDALMISILASAFFWVLLSSIAYIGSNGRYMYSLTILSLTLYVKYSQSKQAEVDR
jgi:hypothetical protein